MPELVPVRVRDCACPDAPHADGDIVYLLPKLSLEGGIAATQDYQEVIGSGGDVAALSRDLTRKWLVTFVRYGFAGSNFDVTLEDLLGDYSLAEPVSEKANDLYYEAVLSPLGLAQPATSPGGPTDGSTSAPTASTPKRRGSLSAARSAGPR